MDDVITQKQVYEELVNRFKVLSLEPYEIMGFLNRLGVGVLGARNIALMLELNGYSEKADAVAQAVSMRVCTSVGNFIKVLDARKESEYLANISDGQLEELIDCFCIIDCGDTQFDKANREFYLRCLYDEIANRKQAVEESTIGSI